MSENKGDLISRNTQNTLIALFMAENCYLNMSALDVLKMVADWVMEAPAVDAVEVVRCGDCKYFKEPFCIRRDDETHRERINMLTVDFCSYGAKMDGGKTNGWATL